MCDVEAPNQYAIRCLPSSADNDGKALLRFTVNGKSKSVRLKIGKLSAQLVSTISDRSSDLLEIASIVYGVDSAVSRGGLADQKMAAKWYRHFQIKIPVREPNFWQQATIIEQLQETLGFLSGDKFEFKFFKKEELPAQPYFEFEENNSWKAQRVLMFSGGLDSFAGALEEIADQNLRVALISHYSANKTAPIQRHLYESLKAKFGENSCRHIPVEVQMCKGGQSEGTHRARSFLFATLGMVTAQALGLDRVSFYENGIVSLNLPAVGNVQSTRATRTTHPQTLVRFTNFFSAVFEDQLKVDNPSFNKTKTEVVQTIQRLGMADQIAHTRSCADVHNRTKQHPHCGRCSQCIDRRFAILAANLTSYDPEDAYSVGLIDGPRKSVIDKEIALAYVRNARAFEVMTQEALSNYFPEIIHALKYLEPPEGTSLNLINQLLTRHGRAVVGAFEKAIKGQNLDNFPESSLARLYGDEKRNAALPQVTETSKHEPAKSQVTYSIQFDEPKRKAVINESTIFTKTATADLLIVLSKKWLEGSGLGLDPFEYPTISAHDLVKELSLQSEEAVRRRISRSRIELRKRIIDPELRNTVEYELIENCPWSGYRLNPSRISSIRKL